MSWSLPAVRDALKTALATIPGLRTYDVAPGQVVVPAAVVVPGEPLVEYQVAMGGGAQLTFNIMLLVQLATERIAAEALDQYMAEVGDHSVKAAVDGNLGGVVMDANVVSVGAYGFHTYAGAEYFGVRFTVGVMV